MKNLRTFFAILSVAYFTIYWTAIIFIPYLSIKSTGTVVMNMMPSTIFIFMHPAMIGGMLLILAMSMFSLGSSWAIDEVEIAKQRAIIKIDNRKKDIIDMVCLGRAILRDDTEIIVQKFIDRVKEEEGLHDSE